MNINHWLENLNEEEQSAVFRKAALFLSSRELSDIISNVKAGRSLYQAHRNAGVIERYSADFARIRRESED